MAGMPVRRLLSAAAAALLVAAGSGCGQGAPETTPRGPATTTPQAPRQPPRPPAPAAATRVIRGWSDTLRGGDEVGAARFFAVPSVVQIEPGQPSYRITRRAQAVAFQAVLPCGARLISAVRDGRYVNALFRLTARRGATCDAPGQTARTDFVIRRGLITEWRRAPDEPGDGSSGPGTTPGAPGESA
jgi:hypothetical protein